jgi:hypothetical protein
MVVVARGRFAPLVDGLGFNLVPWPSVLEQRFGQQLSATLRSNHVTRSFGRREAIREIVFGPFGNDLRTGDSRPIGDSRVYLPRRSLNLVIEVSARA